MNGYAILNSRKRSVIALIHSVVFALIALRSLAYAAQVNPIWLTGSVFPMVMLVVYFVVSSALIQLARLSGSAREKLYFGFCASSATLGLLRNIVGDQNLPAAQYLRLAMLLCAVLTGIEIVRSHSRPITQVNTGL